MSYRLEYSYPYFIPVREEVSGDELKARISHEGRERSKEVFRLEIDHESTTCGVSIERNGYTSLLGILEMGEHFLVANKYIKDTEGMTPFEDKFGNIQVYPTVCRIVPLFKPANKK